RRITNSPTPLSITSSRSMTIADELGIEDRLKARQMPEGMSVMHQDWHKLLFLHWEISPDAIRKLIPEKLSIDTFNGKAWISVTPLTITNLRPPYLPAVPYMSWLYELNVRTYVHIDGVPGV